VQSAGFAQDAGTVQSAGFAQDAGIVQSAGFAQDAGSAGPAGLAAQAATQPVRSPLDQRRRDKFFPLRLAAIMVIAAIIGSVLVLVIR
jgi:hypothetical protein